MRQLAVFACVAVAAAGCIKRVAPSAGDDRTTMSGVPVPFGHDMEVPEGTDVTWDFGDGTPPAKGPTASHAFPRAGAYTVTQTIKDKDGEQRTSQARVTVLRRAVPMAVPSDVRGALILQSPWSKLATHRQVANQLGFASFYDEVARAASDGLGFDALDVKQAAANGFDPDEGFAFYTIPQDPEGLVFAVGTSDDGKALEAAKRLLSQKSIGRLSGGPFQLTTQKLDDATDVLVGQGPAGDRVGVVQKFGYLYLRLPGATDPLPALRSAAAMAPEKGLAIEPKYLAAMRHVGSGDAVFFTRATDKGRYADELGALAFALNDRPDLMQVRIFTELKRLSGDAMKAAFTPAAPPPDLAANLPSGAAAYLRISAAPATLWRELTRIAGAEAMRARDRIAEASGLDLEKDLIPASTGNVGVGVYLDAPSLLEAAMGELVGSIDRSMFLVVAELQNVDGVRAAIERAMKSRPVTDRRSVKDAQWWRLGDGAQAAIRGKLLFVSIGGPQPEEAAQISKNSSKKKKRASAPEEVTPAQLGALGSVLFPQGETLSQELTREKLAGFTLPGVQNLWFDVGGISRSIEKAATEHNADAAKQFAERTSAVRDVLLEVRPGNDGVDSDLYVLLGKRK